MAVMAFMKGDRDMVIELAGVARDAAHKVLELRDRIAELEKELNFLRMTERMANQHASRRDADVAELDAQVARLKAELATWNSLRSTYHADALDRAVKAENERDALEATHAEVMLWLAKNTGCYPCGHPFTLHNAEDGMGCRDGEAWANSRCGCKRGESHVMKGVRAIFDGSPPPE